MICHPDHALYLQEPGKMAGDPVHTLSLDCLDHPMRRKSDLNCNSTQTWHHWRGQWHVRNPGGFGRLYAAYSNNVADPEATAVWSATTYDPAGEE